MAKKKLTVTLDAELIEAAKRQRKKTGRTLTHVVQEALEKWVREEPPKEK